MNKNLNIKRQDGTDVDSDKIPNLTTSNHHLTKPHVIGRQCPPKSYTIKTGSCGETVLDKNFVLPYTLKEGIFSLGFKAKTLEFKDWLDFIMHSLKNVKGFYEWFDKTHSKSEEFSIVTKIGSDFYLDMAQIRELYSLILSNVKLVSPPS